MKKYLFIKISNNNNACVDFHIDISVMRDPRLRISTLKSQYKKYKINPRNIEFKEPWRYFDLDFSFYCIDSGEFETYAAAKEHCLDLYDSEFSRMNSAEI